MPKGIPEEQLATVDDVIEMLQKVSQSGHGSLVLYCNREYVMALKGDIPEVHADRGFVTMGGYD